MLEVDSRFPGVSKQMFSEEHLVSKLIMNAKTDLNSNVHQPPFRWSFCLAKTDCSINFSQTTSSVTL